MSSKRFTTNGGLFVFLAGILGTAIATLCYYLDLNNVPVIAPYLDLIADKIYGWIPYLAVLRQIDRMWVSAVVVGLVCFLVISLIARLVIDRAPGDKVEKRLRKRGLERRKRELGGSGFEVE
jgi:hypothetical protein